MPEKVNKFRKLERGSLVQVKSRREILRILDENGEYEGLPFTSQMWALCGETFKVFANVNRTRIDGFGLRGIKNTVILEDVRCDGESHGSCHRACYLIFKKAWLDFPVSSEGLSTVESLESPKRPSFMENELDRCHGQAPTLLKCTYPLRLWRIDNYLADVFSGQMTLREVASIYLFRLNLKWDVYQPIWDHAEGKNGQPEVAKMVVDLLRQRVEKLFNRKLQNQASKTSAVTDPVPPKSASSVELGLQPGDMVQVRSRDEIAATLNARGRSRGLSFGGCMNKYCGGTYRVVYRADRVIDEKTGNRVDGLPATVALEGVVCDGKSFWGCPRACYWLWREEWLKKIE